MSSSKKGNDSDETTVHYRRDAIVVPCLVMMVGICMSIVGWLMDDSETSGLLVEMLTGFGIEITVGSAVVLFNYLIMGRESQNQDLSEASYENIKNIVSLENGRVLKAVNNSRKLAPTHTFMASDAPNDEFNIIVNEKLTNASEYTYFGDSSRSFVSRLKMIGGDPQKQINVFIPDYRENEIFTAHKLEIRKRYVKTAADTTESAIVTARVRVIQNMYALMRLMDLYNISIYLHKEIPFLRFEMARPKNYGTREKEFLALSFLPIDVNQKRYPSAFFYENDMYISAFNGYIDELKVRAERLEDHKLKTFDFIGAIRDIDESLKSRSEKYIYKEYLEKYFEDI